MNSWTCPVNQCLQSTSLQFCGLSNDIRGENVQYFFPNATSTTQLQMSLKKCCKTLLPASETCTRNSTQPCTGKTCPQLNFLILVSVGLFWSDSTDQTVDVMVTMSCKLCLLQCPLFEVTDSSSSQNWGWHNLCPSCQSYPAWPIQWVCY